MPAGELDRPPNASRNLEHRVHCRGRRRRRPQPLTNHAAGKRRRQRRERAGIIRRVLRGERVEQLVIVAEQRGLSGEHFDEIALRTPLEARHDLAPQPHAPMPELVIHGIAHGCPSQPGADLVRIGAPQLEERSSYPAPDRRHSGEPGRTAPPQHREQHRFGLVVSRMRDEDRRRTRFIRGERECLVSRVPSTCFDIRVSIYVDQLDADASTNFGRCFSNDARIAIGVAAQSVIDVHRNDVEITGAGERKQRERVGAA
jgi:hypothetical protein